MRSCNHAKTRSNMSSCVSTAGATFMYCPQNLASLLATEFTILHILWVPQTMNVTLDVLHMLILIEFIPLLG